MYQIRCDNRDGNRYILHDSRSNDLRVIEPKCELELNKTGTLTFRVQPTHPYFSEIKKLKSEISLYQDGEWIFTGRVLNDEVDINNIKTVECEGILAYLLDSIQRAKAYHITGDSKINDYLTDVLNIHNSQVDDYKQFSVGTVAEVDSTEQFYKISSYEDTLTTISNDLVETFNKTYLSARVTNGVKYIDYTTSDSFPINNQIIQLGKNLLKLNRYVKGEEIATVIVPLGDTVESEETEEGDTVDTKLTIKELPEGLIEDSIYKQDDYIYDEEAVEQFGMITKVITWSGVTEAQNLLPKAIEQLNYYKKLALSIELNAFDLHLLDVNIDSIRVGQKIRVYSPIHRDSNDKILDAYMIVEKMTIDLDAPDKSTITLGNEERSAIDVNSSISKKSSDADKNISSVESNMDNNSDYIRESDFENMMDDYMSDNESSFNNNMTDYMDSNDFKNNMTDYMDSSDFKNNMDDYTKTSDFNSSMKDYIASDDFKNNMTNAGYTKTTGTDESGNTVDLSDYATKQEVNEAFNSLADLIKGV